MKTISTQRVVIGSSLESVLFASKNDCTLILNKVSPPEIFETKESQDWNHLIFLLSMAGKVPFSDKVISIRILEDEKRLKVYTKGEKMVQLECEKIFIFDDENIEGLPIPKSVKKSPKKMVLDWVNVRAGMTHDYQTIETGDEFANELVFYKSPRIDGDHEYKDLAIISFLTDEQIKDHSYSDLMALYKAKDVMKSHGIRGPRNGRDANNPEKYKYYGIKLESDRRQIKKLHMDEYVDTDFISFQATDTQIPPNKYISNMHRYIGDRE